MAKKKNGCAANLLGLIVIGGLGIWGIMYLGDQVFAPDTPKQAAARRQRDAAAAKERERERVAESERWQLEDFKQPERNDLIRGLVEQGVFSRVEYRELGATAWVRPAFYLLDFEDKESFCSVIHAYTATNAREELVAVTLKDALSGKTVGEYGPHWTGGVGLKMK